MCIRDRYWEDQPAAIGVDQLAVARQLGEVELEQFVVGDPLTEQIPGQRVPVRGGVANDRLASLRLAQRPDVDAARFAQVGLGAADVGRGREELPRQEVDGVSTLRCGREFSGSSWPLNLCHGGRWHAVER